MVTTEPKRTIKPYHGIILFALVIAFLILGAVPIQTNLGMGGVALTEIILLVMALAAALLLKVDLKAMFPVKKPKVRQVFGVILLWFGTYLLGILATLIVAFFAPEGMAEISVALNEVFTSVPMLVAYLVVAVMPAICEEALHRGFIMTSMKSIRKEWVIVLVMGLVFGIFHLDVYRFAATAILGMALTYVMLKTENILMPALFHLINNLLAVTASFALSGVTENISAADTTAALSSGLSIGTYLLIGSITPFLILGGMVLLRKKDATAAVPAKNTSPVDAQAMDAQTVENQSAGQPAPAPQKRRSMLKPVLICFGLSFVMLISGGAIIATAVMGTPVLDHTETVSISKDTEPLALTFDVAIPRPYMMEYDLSTERGIIDVTITAEDGSEVYNMSAASFFGSETVTLAEGTYTIWFTFVQSDLEAYYDGKGLEYSEESIAALNTGGDLSEAKSADIEISIR